MPVKPPVSESIDDRNTITRAKKLMTKEGRKHVVRCLPTSENHAGRCTNACEASCK